MQIQNKELVKRIIDISYRLKLSHIGSCLAVLPTLVKIYEEKGPGDLVVLSNGHAALALYVVIEHFVGVDAERIYRHHGTHPDRCATCYLASSSGSLGHGAGIALGMGLANPEKKIYCTISDGEYMEGSVHEAFRIQKDLNIDNVRFYCIINGFSAYKKLNPMKIANELEYNTWCKPVWVDMYAYPKWVQTQEAHYRALTDADYQEFLSYFV